MFFRHLGPRTFSRTYSSISESLSEAPDPINRYRRRLHVGKDHGVILTLDANKFAEKKQQRLSIGNQKTFSARITLRNRLNHTLIPNISYDRTHQTDTRTHWPYPPDTKGFLYYTTPPERPRISGELRFRLTSSDDPMSFASGSDLLRLNGQPWSRPLYVISKSFTPLYQKLREDRLVSDDLHTFLSTSTMKNVLYSRSQLLYTLNDTFLIDFSTIGQYLFVITEKGTETLGFRGRFFDSRDSHKGTPYTGSALARFERSTLRAHKGTRTVVLRFLKIITPVQCVMPLYDGYIARPAEGQLYQRKPSIRSHQQVWSVDLDKQKGLVIRGLRLLWDA
ncbi:hypothetical protein BYT27DRAFT_7205417 [Phlegmacium glaucopus]|nr:hypothetical protein BYT27DRAFT_7205417 [Phlegmacium glaucopus]